MKRLMFAAFAALAACGPALSQTADRLPPVVLQFGPTSEYSTLRCDNFAKTPDGSWRALRRDTFGLGFVQNIVPPATPIQVGAWIYNNVDLYSQLQLQCSGPGVVRARY